MTAQDPRTARSRQALIDAMTRILDSSTSPELNVSDMVKEAGISRPTFYQHFGDMKALVQAATQDRLNATFNATQPITINTSWAQFARTNFRLMLAEMNKNRTFYINVLRGVGGYTATNDVLEMIANKILDRSPMGPVLRTRKSPVSPLAQAHFMSAGVVWLLARRILDESTEIHPEELADHVGILLLHSAGVSQEDFNTAYPEYAN
ncbi:TetR/AcrR family transcriptional regulator [Rothia terrae]|jgi:AcrR family transcriptional regulator|uniref:TetR/AcrR family transcriptional regulator n=1 Tax=Rothia terrae TaxID=396015 RepID=UPI003402296E